MTSIFRNEHDTQSKPSRRGALLTRGILFLLIFTFILALTGRISAAEKREHCFVLSSDQLGPRVYAAEPLKKRTSPPDDPRTGDSWLWWLFLHSPMPPHFEQRSCTVRGKSGNLTIVVEDSAWGSSISESDVNLIIERWNNSSIGPYPDQGINELLSSHFGVFPNPDNYPLKTGSSTAVSEAMSGESPIYLLYYNCGSVGDGFYFWWDLYPDGYDEAYPSNECAVVYLNPTGASGKHSPSDNFMTAVAAHESTHLIHYGIDTNEDTWVDEGLAEFAMWLYGNPDTICDFTTNPDIQLNSWPEHGEDSWAHYIKSYLWTLYFYERFGGQHAIRTLIGQSANGIEGYDNALELLGYDLTVADILPDWAVANYLDDPSIADGRYGYADEVLPPFSTSGEFSRLPAKPIKGTVSPYAADYYRFHSLADISGALHIEFNGSSDDLFSVHVLLIRDDARTEVIHIDLDDRQTGAGNIAPVNVDNAEVILVVARVSETGSGDYTINVSESSTSVNGAVANASKPLRFRLRHPNAFHPQMVFTFELPYESDVTFDVCTGTGRQVIELHPGHMTAGNHEYHWDCRGVNDVTLVPGIYLVSITVGRTHLSRPVLIR